MIHLGDVIFRRKIDPVKRRDFGPQNDPSKNRFSSKYKKCAALLVVLVVIHIYGLKTAPKRSDIDQWVVPEMSFSEILVTFLHPKWRMQAVPNSPNFLTMLATASEVAPK